MAKVHELECTRILDGQAGAEGPVFDSNGRFFMVAPEIEDADGKAAGTIVLVDLASGASSLHAAPAVDGHGGIPAGCQADRAGNLLVADMRLGLLRVEAAGKVEQLATVDADGAVMQGCNDLAFDSAGNLYVTAPAGPIAPQPYTRSTAEAFGSLYFLAAGSRIPKKLDTGFLFSNGIAVTTDDKTLIVAETFTKSLFAYDIVAPGIVENKRLWAKLPGEHEGGPDGMDFDAVGNLLVANWGSGHLEVFAPDGTHAARIKLPFERPSNVHFGQKEGDRTTLYITEHSHHGLWRLTWLHPGQPQFVDRG